MCNRQYGKGEDFILAFFYHAAPAFIIDAGVFVAGPSYRMINFLP